MFKHLNVVYCENKDGRSSAVSVHFAFFLYKEKVRRLYTYAKNYLELNKRNLMKIKITVICP